MQKWLSFITKHALLVIGLLIHIAFFISASRTKWFDFFFSTVALHIGHRGLDFYTVPNGAYSYLHGGDSLGFDPQSTLYVYGVGFPTNYTANHPLLVLLLGTFLILFSPAASFYVWMFLKLFVNLAVLIYFYMNFKDSKYIRLAIFLSLINSTQYLEIEISQFQFLLNMLLFLMLILLAKNEKSPLGGLFYFLTLIAKAIGLLWIPLFFFKRHFEMLATGVGMFLVATVFFLFNHSGDYYINWLWGNFFPSYIPGPTQIFTLYALLKYSTPLSNSALAAIKYASLGLVILLSASKRISLQTGIFLAIVYYLFFYDLTYEYHYTTLVPILAVCLVTRPEFQRLSSRICITLISLPNVLFTLRLLSFWHIKLGPFDATKTLRMDGGTTVLGWQLCVLSRIIPIMLLTVCILRPLVIPIIRNIVTYIANQRRYLQGVVKSRSSNPIIRNIVAHAANQGKYLKRIIMQVNWTSSITVLLSLVLVLLLAIGANGIRENDNTWPRYNPPPHVDAPLYNTGGDMTFHYGSVIDGIANIYLIFWIDASIQSPGPRYVSLVEQFVKDMGQSSLYADLLQYHDGLGRHPTGARLAGTFTDTHPFPSSLVTARNAPSYNSRKSYLYAFAVWTQEIQKVAASQGWNIQNYHNLFILLPTMNWGCGLYSAFSVNHHIGSPYAFVPYPYYDGQEQCALTQQSPNQDHIADITISNLSHQIMAAISNPYGSGWYSSNGDIGSKCHFISSATINPKTDGNVTWHGHTYAIQEEYDDYRHGCVLEGP